MQDKWPDRRLEREIHRRGLALGVGGDKRNGVFRIGLKPRDADSLRAVGIVCREHAGGDVRRTAGDRPGDRRRRGLVTEVEERHRDRRRLCLNALRERIAEDGSVYMLRLDASKAGHLERLKRKRLLAAGERKRLARDRIPNLIRVGMEVDRARPLADVAVDYGPVGALVRDIAANSECSRPTAADKDFALHRR